MSFYIIHEIKRLSAVGLGRIRIRADRPLSLKTASLLSANLASLPGIRGVHVTPCLGSVLFFYADQDSRESALQLLITVDEGRGTQEDNNLPVEEPPEDGPMQLVRYFIIRPLLPPFFRMISCVCSAIPFLVKGLSALLHGRLSVEVLDASAILASLCMRDFRTVTMLTLLLGLGDTLAYWTRRHSMESLTESLALNVENVWKLQDDGTEISVPLSQISEGDLVVVRDGGAIPVDGIVEDGVAMVNQSSMTGEPLAVQRSKGSSVFASTVVEEGRIVVRVSSVGDKTRIRQVVSFIEESEQLKASIQGKTERLADMAVPFTFALAGIVFLITRNLRRAASVLLVDYSCALKLATPLAVLSSMREGAAHGVVIKGGRYLEALNEADTLVFDKTGTLTNATPQVVDVIAAEGHDPRDVLKVMACLEEHFPHPVARSVVRKAQQENIRHEEEHDEVEYIVAHGVASTLHGKKLRVGSRHYIENDEGIDVSPLEKEIVRQTSLGRSLLYLAEDGKIAGMLAIEDPLRPEAVEVIQELRGEGFKRILMLTGDDTRTARAIAKRAGITEFRAQILPADKAQIVKELSDSGCRVLMVGDGINDAPALSASHVGVAMVDGTDLAQEVANVLLTRPDLHGIVTARRLARATLNRIHRNFAITLVANSLFIAGGLFMILQPGLSALLHNLTTLGVSLYAMRPYLPAEQNETLDTAAAEAEA